MPRNNYEDDSDIDNPVTTAYGLVSNIKQDIEELGLEDAYTALTVDLEINGRTTEVNYTIEATEIYDELNKDPETAYFESSGRIETPDHILPADEEIITQSLEEELDSALKVNGKVVRELISPDYNAF